MYDELWNKLSPPSVNGDYTIIGINNPCKPDLLLAMNYSGHRCLILSLSKSIEIDIKLIKKSYLTLIYDSELNYLILTLTESDFNDLFDDLINSFYNAIENETDLNLAAKLFIETFVKWNLFFEKNTERSMSKTTVIGLFGELVKLNELIKLGNQWDINGILSSWKGPYGCSHDFELEHKSIEIKTKLESSNAVKISSEYQLEREENKPISLEVISVKEDSVKGVSLAKLVNEIKNRIVSLKGDIGLLYTALYQLELEESSLILYENWRFIQTSIITYDCENIEFPRIISSEISNSLRGVKYSLYLNELHNFITKKECF